MSYLSSFNMLIITALGDFNSHVNPPHSPVSSSFNEVRSIFFSFHIRPKSGNRLESCNYFFYNMANANAGPFISFFNNIILLHSS